MSEQPHHRAAERQRLSRGVQILASENLMEAGARLSAPRARRGARDHRVQAGTATGDVELGRRRPDKLRDRRRGTVVRRFGSRNLPSSAQVPES